MFLHFAALALASPTLPGSTWTAEGNQAGAGLGTAVATADVNGDGYDDVVVGAPGYRGALASEGAVSLYLGSAAGVAAVSAWATVGGQAAAEWGDAVASAGDVNGDGREDVIVGAHVWDNPDRSEGVARLYLGSPAGLQPAPVWSAEGNQVDASFGESVACAGDVNGDGYDDVVVGATGYANGQSGEGAAFLYLGSAAGLAAVPAWTAEGEVAGASFGEVAPAGDVNGDGYDDVLVGAPGWSAVGRAALYLGSTAGLGATPVWTADGSVAGERLGASVASAGDLNGDGYDDLLIGAPGYADGQASEGAVHVFLGSATGPGATPARIVELDQAFASLGERVAAAGDVDGDGFDDVVFGTPWWDGATASSGGAWLYLGSPLGLAGGPAWAGESDQAWARFGDAVASGDLDGDGRADLLIGARQYDAGQADEGVVFGYQGLLADGDGDGVPTSSDLCPEVADPSQRDADADGVGDACDDPILQPLPGPVSVGLAQDLRVVGVAPGEVVAFLATTGPGAVGPCPAVLGGLCLDLGPGATLLGTAAADATGEASIRRVVPATLQPDGTYALQAAVARGAAGVNSVASDPVIVDGWVLDWDADGLRDAVEGALGTDPADADTDGDGLPDPAELGPHLDPRTDDTDGDGVGDGVDLCRSGDDAMDTDLDGVPDPCDSCAFDSDPSQADRDGDGLGDVCEGAPLVPSGWVAERDATNGLLGSTVGSAGDVNGDGYGDVLVRVGKSTNQVLDSYGTVLVYHGSAAGPSAAADWVTSSPMGSTGFGEAAAVGDVDGDGYGDVVVGEPCWQSWNAPCLGAASLYFGSAAGLEAAPGWRVAPGGPGDDNRFGSGVAVGDVTGDGYDDVVVAADGYGDHAGLLVLYRGTAAGLSPAASWTVEGSGPGQELGGTIAVVDVDGDGREDLLVSGRTATTLYRGTATGLARTPDWATGGFPVVAAAGDVNGDGYGDVVVADPAAEDGEGGHGVAQLFLGSFHGLSDTAAWVAHGDQAAAGFGTSAGSAGDVDGDGYDDVVIGAPGYDDGELDECAVALFLGGPAGLARAPSGAVGGDQPGAAFGACAAAAGDVDGDGLDDVVVGAPRYDGGQSDEGSATLYRGRAP